MSPRSACLPHSRRKEIIKDNVTKESYIVLAKRCGCTKRTIIRSVNLMKETGEWWDFLERGMLLYGRSEDVSDEVKFKEYAKLYGKKFIIEKKELETKIKGPIEIRWNRSDNSAED